MDTTRSAPGHYVDAANQSDFHAAAAHLRCALAALDHINASVAAALVSMALDYCEREAHSGALRSER